jgi:dephospho-CoA kinase
MLKAALTGGIATGKSHVLERFRRRGVPCLDADALAHGVEAAGTEATQAIAARFGSDVLATDGSVDRAKLGPMVFADKMARADLEAIVHPAVYRAITAGLRAFELIENPRVAVVDIPLLFETGRASDFDVVIATVCPADMQIHRLVRRGMSEAEARQRIAAQLPAAEKAARANHVIDTGGAFEETDAQVQRVLDQLLKTTESAKMSQPPNSPGGENTIE